MTAADDMTELVRYHRERASNEGDDALIEIANRVPEGARMLDVGCGPGTLGRFLAGRNVHLVGIDASQEFLTHAAPFYNATKCLNLNDDKALDGFETGSFDVIACADVLEHLLRPREVLIALKRLIAPKGQLLVSVPNVQYAGVILSLLQGRFVRSTAGLLDDTHLHFFTRRSFTELLEDAGFEIETIKAIELDIEKSEFRQERPESVEPAIYELLDADPDSSAYQFVIVAKPALQGAVQRQPAVTRGGAHAAGFFAELFWRSGPETFLSRRKLRAYGRVGEMQRLEFKCQALADPVEELRYDPSNRAGFIHLRRMEIFDERNERVWRWDGDPTGLREGALVGLTPLDPSRPGHYLVEGSDPQIYLPVPLTTLQRLRQGFRLVVEQSWPWSADFEMARATIDALRERVAAAESRQKVDVVPPANPDAQLSHARKYMQAKQHEWMDERRSYLQKLSAAEARERELMSALEHAQRTIDNLNERLGSSAHVLAQFVADRVRGGAKQPVAKVARWLKRRVGRA